MRALILEGTTPPAPYMPHLLDADALWRDLEGFTPPCCPECMKPADLDEDGYWCSRCSDIPWSANPDVDSIPNGAEFAELLALWRQKVGLE